MQQVSLKKSQASCLVDNFPPNDDLLHRSFKVRKSLGTEVEDTRARHFGLHSMRFVDLTFHCTTWPLLSCSSPSHAEKKQIDPPWPVPISFLV